MATCADQTECANSRQPDRIFDRRDFQVIIEDFENDFNRPTGLGVDEIVRRKGPYTGLADEYDNDYNRPTGLGRDDPPRPDLDSTSTETGKNDDDSQPETGDTEAKR